MSFSCTSQIVNVAVFVQARLSPITRLPAGCLGLARRYDVSVALNDATSKSPKDPEISFPYAGALRRPFVSLQGATLVLSQKLCGC